MGRFQPTEAGFILEGEVRKADGGESESCSVTGTEPFEEWHTTQHSLFEALKRYEGQNVRITVEVVDAKPLLDALNELVERFRHECEDPPPSHDSNDAAL